MKRESNDEKLIDREGRETIEKGVPIGGRRAANRSAKGPGMITFFLYRNLLTISFRIFTVSIIINARFTTVSFTIVVTITFVFTSTVAIAPGVKIDHDANSDVPVRDIRRIVERRTTMKDSIVTRTFFQTGKEENIELKFQSKNNGEE
uniref:Uncharacterized protein n=1 Tax=Pristionchus pacificus TaxID=54126 RepID=A0A2A6CYN5_PRIPA|eukprot:PDM83220.1 hypothetical protein PRIPAC_34852 [Pristionchus pacificus]